MPNQCEITIDSEIDHAKIISTTAAAAPTAFFWDNSESNNNEKKNETEKEKNNNNTTKLRPQCVQSGWCVCVCAENKN